MTDAKQERLDAFSAGSVVHDDDVLRPGYWRDMAMLMKALPQLPPDNILPENLQESTLDKIA